MEPAPLGRIHLVLDLDVLSTVPRSEDRLRALLQAGLDSLQLRGPGYATADLIRNGRPIAALAREYRIPFVVNADLEAAEALDAYGLHLPARAGAPAEVRSTLPAGMRIGASVHDAAELARAHGADWILVSPVFPTPSKPGAVGLGPEGLRALATASSTPVYALGGIAARHVPACRAAGVAGVAAIRALLGPDGETLVRAAHAAWDAGGNGVSA